MRTRALPRLPLDARRGLATLGLSIGLLFHAGPSIAEIDYVAPSQVTQAARAIPQQQVNTGEIWALLAGGALGIFGITYFVENQDSMFPAIARANRAMRMDRPQDALAGTPEAAVVPPTVDDRSLVASGASHLRDYLVDPPKWISWNP